MSNPSHSFRRSLEAFSRAVRGGGACATLCLGALALGTGCSAEAEIPEVTVTRSDVEFEGVPSIPGITDTTQEVTAEFDHPSDFELPEDFNPELRPLGTNRYEDDTTRVVEHVFETTWDGPVSWADGEVVAGGWMSLDELARQLSDPTWAFVPDTRSLLARLAAGRVGDYGRLTP